MKRLFRIFELSKNEQRVILIVILALIVIAFVRFERRVHRSANPPVVVLEAKSSPSPVQTEDEQ